MGNISSDIKSTFISEKHKALVNIKYTANWINNREVESLKPFGISPQQYNILRILKGGADKMKVQLVKQRMIEKSPNATRLMDKLCEKLLIDRFRCDEDRRVVYIKINDKGLKRLKQIGRIKSLDYLDNLTEEEAKNLSELLDKIR